MPRFKIGRPSAGLIVAVLALVVALGGSAVAITALNKREKQQVKRIATKLDKRISESSSEQIKDLRRDIKSPKTGKIALPVLPEPVCGVSEGWYGYTPHVAANDGPAGAQRPRADHREAPIDFTNTYDRVVRLSGDLVYCGGPKVAFTLPKAFRPTDYPRRFPIVAADSPPEGAEVTVIVWPRGYVQIGLNGRVSVPDAEVGDIVDFGSVSYSAGGPNTATVSGGPSTARR